MPTPHLLIDSAALTAAGAGADAAAAALDAVPPLLAAAALTALDALPQSSTADALREAVRAWTAVVRCLADDARGLAGGLRSTADTFGAEERLLAIAAGVVVAGPSGESL